MTTSDSGWLRVAAGLVTMTFAVWVAWSLAAPATQNQAAPPSTEVSITETSATSSVAPVVITTPPPEMEGLSETVARVLASEGFASELSAQDIADQLPASVYRTLVDHGVTLSVATENPGQ